MSIGERDIEFYKMCAENERRALRNCEVSQEPYYRERLSAANEVVVALIQYTELCAIKAGS